MEENENEELLEGEVLPDKTDIIEKMIQEEESKPISKKIEDIIIQEVKERLDIKQLETLDSQQELKKSRRKSLYEAVNTLKTRKLQLEEDIQELIYEFEDSSKLKINKIDLVINSKNQDYGFKEYKNIERSSPFGFSDEVKTERKYIIKITLDDL